MIRRQQSPRLGRKPRHRREGGRSRGRLLLALAVGVMAVAIAACHGGRPSPDTPRPRPADAPPAPASPPAVTRAERPLRVTIGSVPAVRVRVARGASRVTLDAASALSVTSAPGVPAAARTMATPMVVTVRDGALLVRPRVGQTLRWNTRELSIHPVAADVVEVDGRAYPGRLRVRVASGGDGDGSAALDVINDVPIEAYLPGVLERELYATWSPATFRAQAVAARSYAIVQAYRKRNEPFDLESTTASQVYGGRASNPRAIDAVRLTRGRVLVHDGRVVTAFYSSCCGGAGQDAAAAFGVEEDLPPLRGTRHDWCHASPHYRWGPIRRDADELARRLRAWGVRNRHAVAAIDGFRQITVPRRNRTGRPTAFVVTDARGRRFEMACESFRHACNAAATGLPAVTRSDRIKSSHVDVSVRDGEVVFATGRGYGHGVGLCQWGAEGMALRGYDERAILGTYYPGATIEAAY